MSEPARVPDGGWGWVIVGASFLLQALTVGVTYTFGIIFVELLEYFKESQSATAWVGSIQPALFYFTGVIGAPLIEKFGFRVVTVIGSIISAAGFSLSCIARDIFTLYVTYGVMTGFGFGLMYLTSMVTVQHYFNKHRALATGLAVSGSGVGTLLCGFVAPILLKWYGWRLTVLIEGATTLVIGVCCAALFRPVYEPHSKSEYSSLLDDSPHEKDSNRSSITSTYGTPTPTHRGIYTARSITDSSTPSTSLSERHTSTSNSSAESFLDPPQLSPVVGIPEEPELEESMFTGAAYETKVVSLSPLIEDPTCCGDCCDTCCRCWHDCCHSFSEKFHLALCKNPVLALYALTVVLFCFGYHVPFTYTTDRAISMLKIPKSKASFLISVMGITGVISRLFFGWVGDHSPFLRRVMLGAAIILCGVISTLIMYFDTYQSLIIYSIGFSIMAGCFTSLFPVVIVDLLGISLIDYSLGLCLTSSSLAFLLASPISGWIIQVTSNYNAPFVVMGCVQIVGGLVFYSIGLVQKQCPKYHHQISPEYSTASSRTGSVYLSESIA